METLKRDIGKRHWKETRGEIARIHIEILDGYTWRHKKEAQGYMEAWIGDRLEDIWI